MAALGAELPSVLAATLSADNEARRAAEARLNKLGKDAAVVPALLEQLQRGAADEIRQLAAIILRKRIAAHWLKLQPPTREALKTALLDAIVRESRCARRTRGARRGSRGAAAHAALPPARRCGAPAQTWCPWPPSSRCPPTSGPRCCPSCTAAARRACEPGQTLCCAAAVLTSLRAAEPG
jgi:hypothetical protein